MNMQTYLTSDFPVAVTLLTKGFKLDTLDRSDPQRIVFHFMRNKGLDDVLELYWKGEMQVEPQQFYLNQKLLKNRILEDR
jgi:hypothetical protein